MTGAEFCWHLPQLACARCQLGHPVYPPESTVVLTGVLCSVRADISADGVIIRTRVL